jgi:hypothetical protein
MITIQNIENQNTLMKTRNEVDLIIMNILQVN